MTPAARVAGLECLRCHHADPEPLLCAGCPRRRDAGLAATVPVKLESLESTTLREQADGYERRNLIGSPDEICERVRACQQAGVTTLSGMLFVASTVPEMHEAIELFGREVIPHFT